MFDLFYAIPLYTSWTSPVNYYSTLFSIFRKKWSGSNWKISWAIPLWSRKIFIGMNDIYNFCSTVEFPCTNHFSFSCIVNKHLFCTYPDKFNLDQSGIIATLYVIITCNCLLHELVIFLWQRNSVLTIQLYYWCCYVNWKVAQHLVGQFEKLIELSGERWYLVHFVPTYIRVNN